MGFVSQEGEDSNTETLLYIKTKSIRHRISSQDKHGCLLMLFNLMFILKLLVHNIVVLSSHTACT